MPGFVDCDDRKLNHTIQPPSDPTMDKRDWVKSFLWQRSDTRVASSRCQCNIERETLAASITEVPRRSERRAALQAQLRWSLRTQRKCESSTTQGHSAQILAGASRVKEGCRSVRPHHRHGQIANIMATRGTCRTEMNAQPKGATASDKVKRS